MKEIWIEVIEGSEGPSLSITDEDKESGGLRIAGPKPWGGGRVSRSFKVFTNETTLDEIQTLIDRCRK